MLNTKVLAYSQKGHDLNIRLRHLLHVLRLGIALWIAIGAALWIEAPVLCHPYTQIVGGIPDAFQYTWYIGWFWHAVVHGTNPFVSHELNWPNGFGLMYNTSVLAESVLFGWLVPFTSPVFVYNLAFFVNVICIGLLGYGLLREIGVRTPIALWGTISFCFMPYLTAQGLGHMSQYFVSPLLAVVFLFTRVVNNRTQKLRTYGMGIGVLCAFEFYTSLEITVTFALSIGIFVGYMCLQKQGRAWLKSHVLPIRFWMFLSASAAILVVPGIVEFVMTGGIYFSTHELHANTNQVWVADVLSPLYPTRLFLLHTAFTDHLTMYSFLGDLEEKGNYLGVFLLATVGLVYKAWKGPIARSVFGVWVTMLVLSFGDTLHYAGRALSIDLPWSLISRLPFLNSALPIRLALYVDAAIIIWLAMSFERLLDSRKSKHVTWNVMIASVLILVSWLPSLGYQHKKVYVLPKVVAETIGTAPAYWISANFGYDMEVLATSKYRLNAYDLYGFDPASSLGQVAYNPTSMFDVYPYHSARDWADQIALLKQTLHAGYVVWTPFNPENVTVNLSSLKQAMFSVLGKPLLQSDGCIVWSL